MDTNAADRLFHQRLLSPSAPPEAAQATRLHLSHGHQPFRPLPAPTGAPPYHLSLADVLPPTALAAIAQRGQLVLHITGDTGAPTLPTPQLNVARAMEAEFAGAERPSFCYLLGDVVYYFGAASAYYPQFYEPYATYPAPIFGIPGNHDGDLSPEMETAGVPSLAAFVNNFCQRIPHHTREALDVSRRGMTQPNVYWTLETPLVTIVGLYTNVPDGGRLDPDQVLWLETELAQAPAQRALLVTMHHPLYSVDDFHSGSLYLEQVLEEAMQRAQRIPDAVLAGHVHNYQRFTRRLGGRAVPCLVAGAGGYHHLHRVQASVRTGHAPPVAVPGRDDLTLEAYCDDRYGYLRLTVSADAIRGDYLTVPGTHLDGDVRATPLDSFTVDVHAHTVATLPVAGGSPGAAPATPPAPARRPAGGRGGGAPVTGRSRPPQSQGSRARPGAGPAT